MTGRETLIKVLESAESAIYWNSSDKGFIEKVANHLIANDVVPVVRCKDCKHFLESFSGTHSCKLHKGLVGTKYDTFCSYGERRTDA